MDTEMTLDSSELRRPLGLLATPGARELGALVDAHLTRLASAGGGSPQSFLIVNDCPRFASGDGKGIIYYTVRGMDLYFLTDVGNYSCEYTMFGRQNRMSPDDHFVDLKRLIQAAGGKAHRMTVIMPLLYGSRQHRRNARESLDCAAALQELIAMGVSDIVTFDAHDPRVQNAIPLNGFDNFMSHYQVLKALLHHFPELSLEAENFMLVSPDEGAINRSMYYSSVLNVDIGMYYKRRDYSKLVNGRNPIVAHEYLGGDVSGKTILIADDQIGSGESALEVARDLKAKRAGKIFLSATYALFTHGLEEFDRAYSGGIIDGVFGTNLTYRTDELKQREWFFEVDCSKYIAYIIAAIYREISVSAMLDPHEKIKSLLERHNAALAER